MKVYYKGEIITSRSNDSSIFKLRLIENNFTTAKSSYYDKNWNKDESDYFKAYFKNYRHKITGITDEVLIKILNKLPENYFKACFTNFVSIIYELVEDTVGNLYAKELHTGLIFPLMNNPKIQYFYDIDDCDNFNLEKIFTHTNENLARHVWSAKKVEVASINELNEYLNKTNNKKAFREFIDKIQKYYNDNVFNKKISLKDNEPKEEQSEITKLMEEIEYLLHLIKKYDINSYDNFKTKYDDLCTSNQNTNNYYEPNKKEFKNLLSSLKLYLIVFGENCKNTKDFLQKLSTKYLEKLMNNDTDKININISDIDNFTDLFLKSKNDYTIFEQRDTLYLISLLYVFVIMSSFDTIDEKKLEESYFSDNKKTILLIIDTLIENKIIDSNIQIDFSKEYTSKEVFDMIKELKFNKNNINDIKKLVK